MTAQANPNTDLRPGMILGGKYRLDAEIGRGAMGTVWRAIHESLDRRVAIKVISSEHAGSEELVKRFDTEARAAAKLRSRFVVGVSDNGETESGLPYIVMEYLEGECLEDRITRKGTLTIPETAQIARHVTRALSRAHSHGIVHRDLKPANIFIARSEDDEDSEDWTAKVLDFGIAKMDDFGDRSTTKTGTVLGTPLFMSPEQVRGASDVDARADLYSLGMVVYNMLTGTYAFEGQSFGDLLVSICTDPLPNLNKATPGLPPELNDWFQKACARDPNDRFQTSEEMMQTMSNIIDDTSSFSGQASNANTTKRYHSPLAETHIADDGSLIDSAPSTDPGSRESTGAPASAVTVRQIPKKNRRSLAIGLAATAALVGFIGFRFAAGSGGESTDISKSATATEERDLDSPSSSAAKVEPEAPRQPDEAEQNNDEAEQNNGNPQDVETARNQGTENPRSPNATTKPPAPQARPAATKPPIVKPRVVPRPRPKPKSNVPDLGF